MGGSGVTRYVRLCLHIGCRLTMPLVPTHYARFQAQGLAIIEVDFGRHNGGRYISPLSDVSSRIAKCLIVLNTILEPQS